MTDQELARRRRAVANAVANQRLEGLDVDPQTISELEKAATGELSVDDVLQSVKSRFASGAFRT